MAAVMVETTNRILMDIDGGCRSRDEKKLSGWLPTIIKVHLLRLSNPAASKELHAWVQKYKTNTRGNEQPYSEATKWLMTKEQTWED